MLREWVRALLAIFLISPLASRSLVFPEGCSPPKWLVLCVCQFFLPQLWSPGCQCWRQWYQHWWQNWQRGLWLVLLLLHTFIRSQIGWEVRARDGGQRIREELINMQCKDCKGHAKGHNLTFKLRNLWRAESVACLSKGWKYGYNHLSWNM